MESLGPLNCPAQAPESGSVIALNLFEQGFEQRTAPSLRLVLPFYWSLLDAVALADLSSYSISSLFGQNFTTDSQLASEFSDLN